LKKGTKIFLTILFVFILALGTVIYIQQNNIRAFVLFLLHTEESIQEMLEQNAEAINTVMEKVPDLTLRELTYEEHKRLVSNELSPEDAIRLVLGHSVSGSSASVEITESSEASISAEIPEINGNEETAVIEPEPVITPLESLFAEIYLLQLYFMQRLNELSEEAALEFGAISEEERTTASQQRLTLKYIRAAASLEEECDAMMDDILIRIEEELINTGGDVTIVTDIKTIYVNEKNLRKAEFLASYTN
jgi:hypothetical protein